MDQVCIICGLGRSGSTIVQRVLDSHPDVFISDESWHFLQMAQRYNSRNVRTMMGMDDDTFCHCLANHMFDLYTAAAGHKVATFGDKCPPAIFHINTIRHVMSSLEKDCVFIITIRHPYDQAISWITRFGNTSLHELSFYGFRPSKNEFNQVEVIQEIFKVWKNQCDLFGAANSIVKYEDLVTSPEATFKEIHAKIGLEFYKSQLSEAFTKRVVGGDPKFNDTKNIHTDRVYAWRKQDKSTRDALLSCSETTGIIDTMEKFGYDKK